MYVVITMYIVISGYEKLDFNIIEYAPRCAKKCGFTLRRFFHSKIFCSQRRLSVRVINANLEPESVKLGF